MDDDVRYDVPLRKLDESVFQVVIQHQYSAADELAKFLEANSEHRHREDNLPPELESVKSSTGGRRGSVVSVVQQNVEKLQQAPLVSKAELARSEVEKQKYLKALEKGRANEAELNARYMREKTGNLVVYGDVIQLKHVKSGKYLSVCEARTSMTECENLVVELVATGSSLSWLTVQPRFKIDKVRTRASTSQAPSQALFSSHVTRSPHSPPYPTP